jgi:predicted  nucleic acid-binding Zn-ribbon protein
MEANGDVAALRAQLEEKTAELEAMKRTYEEYMESSLALEKELEDSLQAAEDNLAAMTKKKALAEDKLVAAQDKYAVTSKELTQLQTDVQKAQTTIATLDQTKRQLESVNDELQERVRILESTEETLQHKLSKAEEDIVMLDVEIDEMRAEFSDKEQSYKRELTEMQAEIAKLSTDDSHERLRNNDNSFVEIAPTESETHDKEVAAMRDGASNGVVILDDGDVPAHNTTTTETPASPDVHPSDSKGKQHSQEQGHSPKTSDNNDEGTHAKHLQDELISELELEIEFLNTKLAAAEEQNQQLNEEINRMSDELISAHENQQSSKQDDTSSIAPPDSSNRDADLAATEAASSLKHFQDEYEKSRLLMEQLQADLQAVSEQLKTTSDQLEEEKLKSESKEKVLPLLNDDVSELSHQLQAKSQELSAVVEVADQVKQANKASIASLESQLKSVSEQLVDAKKEKDGVLRSLQELQSSVLTLKSQWESEKSELVLSVDTWKKRALSAASNAGSPTYGAAVPSSVSKLSSPRSSRCVTPSRRIAFKASIGSVSLDGGEDGFGNSDVMGSMISMAISPADKEKLGLAPTTPLMKTFSKDRVDISPRTSTELPRSSDPESGAVVTIDTRSTMAASAETAILSGDVVLLQQEVKNQLKLLESLRSSNAKLLQKLQAARGNIIVACRTRPPNEYELTSARHTASSTQTSLHANKICVDIIDDNELACYDTRSEVWRSFVFDRIWPMNCQQADVFADVEPLILSVIDGYNCCLFAYGQTVDRVLSVSMNLDTLFDFPLLIDCAGIW